VKKNRGGKKNRAARRVTNPRGRGSELVYTRGPEAVDMLLKGMSVSAIAARMGHEERSVRRWLKFYDAFRLRDEKAKTNLGMREIVERRLLAMLRELDGLGITKPDMDRAAALNDGIAKMRNLRNDFEADAGRRDLLILFAFDLVEFASSRRPEEKSERVWLAELLQAYGHEKLEGRLSREAL